MTQEINFTQLSNLSLDKAVLGVTGSRYLIKGQRLDIDRFLSNHADWIEKADCVIGGACKGVDIDVFRWMRNKYPDVPRISIVPANRKYVDEAYKSQSTHFAYMPEDTDYKERNQLIVSMSNMLLGIPTYDEEDAPRSGSWQTIRMARQKGITTLIYTLTYQEVMWEIGNSVQSVEQIKAP